MGTAKRNTICAYAAPMSMIDLLSVNMARKGAVIAMQTTAKISPWIILKSVPSDAALSAVFCFCAPRKYAIVALKEFYETNVQIEEAESVCLEK